MEDEFGDVGEDGGPREQGGNGGLWDEAWSKPRRPGDEPPRSREQWDPSARQAAGMRPEGATRSNRRSAGIDTRGVGHEFRGVKVEPVDAPIDHRAPRRPAGSRPARPGRDPDARSLAPRPAVVGYGHRRGRGPAVLLLSVAALLALVALGWWFFTRPTSVGVGAVPADAQVRLRGTARTGALSVADAEPGAYAFEVSRAGFATRTVQVELGRWEQVHRTVTLEPLPQRLTFVSRPKGAAVKVTGPDGKVLTGSTPCALTAPAGTMTVEIAKPGCNAFTRTIFVDVPHTFDLLLDPKGQVVHALGSLTAGGAPKGVAVSPGGVEAWSAILNGKTSVEIFDLKTLKKTGGVDLGKYGAVEVIFNRDGSKAYASQMETAKVFEIDVKTRKVARSFKTGSAWTKVIALSPDEKRLYAANWSGNDVSVISLETGDLLKRIPTAKTPRGLWPTADGRYLYVAGFDRGEIQRIDLRTYGIKTLFKSGGAMRHLVADEQRGILYASDMGKDVVWKLDMKTGRTTRFCATDHKPNTIDLSPDGRVLFVSNRGENNPKSYYIPGYEWGTILLYDTVTAKPLDAIVGGNQCTALDVSDDGGTLVFSDFLDNRLRVYSVPSYETLAKSGGGRFKAHFAALKKRT